MVETSESPWNRRIFLGGNPGFLGQTNGSLYRDSLILLRFHVAKHTIHGSSGYRSELIFFSLYQLFFWGENRSTHVGPSINHQHMCFIISSNPRAYHHAMGETIVWGSNWDPIVEYPPHPTASHGGMAVCSIHTTWRQKKDWLGIGGNVTRSQKNESVRLHFTSRNPQKKETIVTQYINYTPGNQTQLPNHDGSWSPCIPFQIYSFCFWYLFVKFSSSFCPMRARD